MQLLEFESLSSDKKLSVLFTELQYIKKQIHTPWWRRMLNWFVANFFQLLALAVLLFLTWQVWLVVQYVDQKVDHIATTYHQTKDSVQDTWQGVGDKIRGWLK